MLPKKKGTRIVLTASSLIANATLSWKVIYTISQDKCSMC